MTFDDFWEVYEKDMKPKLKYNTRVSKKWGVKEKILPYFSKLKMSESKARDII